MLTTSTKNILGIEISDSTIMVRSGVAHGGTDIINHDGTTLTFSDITVFTGSSQYQNSLLYVQKSLNRSIVDSTTSPVAAAIENLTIPDLPSNTSPLALFRFFSSDGTSVSLNSYNEILR